MTSGPDIPERYPEPIALGVCDPAGAIAAIDAGGGDVRLVDLVEGAERGRLDGLGVPLMIDADCLVGRRGPDGADHIRLFRVPLAHLQPVAWSQPVDVPEWLGAGDDGGQDTELSFMRCGTVYRLYWRGRDRYRGGAPPPASLTQGMAQRQGAQRIDFDVATLAVVARRDEDGFAAARAREERGEQLARDAGGLIYCQAGELRNAPWPTEAGERYLRSFGAPGDKERPLALADADADAGAPAAAAALETGLAQGQAPELALDGRHLAVPAAADGSPARLDVYETASARHVGSIAPPPGFGSFRLFGDRMICLGSELHPEPAGLRVLRRLHAIDVAKGNPIWVYDLPAQIEPDRYRLPPKVPS